MEGWNLKASSVRDRSINRKKGKTSNGRTKLRGKLKLRLTSPTQLTRRCWQYGNPGHCKKDCKSKGVDKNKESKEIQSTERKLTQEEKGDVHLASTST